MYADPGRIGVFPNGVTPRQVWRHIHRRATPARDHAAAASRRTCESIRNHVQSILRPPDPELPLRAASAALGAGRSTGSRRRRFSRRAAAPSSSRRSPSRRSARAPPPQEEIVFDEGQGAFDEGAAVRPDLDHQRSAPACGPLAGLAQSQSVAGYAGDGPPPAALAASRFQRHPPLLLSGRSGGNGHLADRGRAALQDRQAPARPPRQRQPGRQSRADAPRAEARHRRRQDDRHGDAHRLADDQRGAPPRQQALHARLSGRARPA